MIPDKGVVCSIMYLFSKVCLKVKVFIVKNLKELPLCNGAHFCFYTQPGPKAAQSRGDYPWPQVLHWLWRKGGQPVHSGCQTGGQNRHGVQGTATKKKNYMLPMFCVQFYFWLSVLVLSTSVNNIVLENPTFSSVFHGSHRHLDLISNSSRTCKQLGKTL